jgi:phage/plasmid primase-like uncharacterized protein
MIHSAKDKLLQQIERRLTDSPLTFKFNETFFRFGNKKNCWAIGHKWSFKGNDYYMSYYGSWTEGTSHVFRSFKMDDSLTQPFRKTMKDSLLKIESKINEEKELNSINCINEWKPKFDNAVASEVHPYLSEKKITESFGSRIDSNGTLLIPIFNNEKFLGVQRIYKNNEDRYEKRFSSGVRKKGSYLALKPILGASLVYVCEGFATAATVQMAAPDSSVVCAWDCGNIEHAIKTIREICPLVNIVICADYDNRPKSKAHMIGEKKAQEATEKFINVTYVVPKFKDDKKGSDFNDLHTLEGLEVVSDQLSQVNYDVFHFVKAIGCDDNNFYFTSSINNNICKIGQRITKDQLFTILPNKRYWASKYPTGNGNGIDVESAGLSLRNEAYKAGVMGSIKQRGTGAWLDSKRVVVNTGFDLLVDNMKLQYHFIDSRYIYTPGHTVDLSESNLMDKSLRKDLICLVNLLPWSQKDSSILFIGWIANSILSGLSPWRSHIWLTGSSGSGKSTVIDQIIKKCFGEFCHYFLGNSTEPGMRQTINNNSLPVIFDEFEADNNESLTRITKVIELIRQASSSTKGLIYKGSQSGTSTSFTPRFAALVSSIRVNLINKADRNRFTVLELDKNKHNENDYLEMNKIMSKIFNNESTWKKIVSYIINHQKIYLSNYKKIESLLRVSYGGHFPKQYASLLSGYLLIESPIVRSETFLNKFISTVNLDRRSNDTDVDDEVSCLKFLLEIPFKISNIGSENSLFINQLLEGKDNYDMKEVNKGLSQYGIRIGKDFVYVSNNNSNLRKEFKETQWENNWGKALKRITDVDDNEGANIRLGGQPEKCSRIHRDKLSDIFK